MIRRVFGRVKNVKALSGTWTFEMSKSGVMIKRKHKRTMLRLSFEQLIDAAQGQISLEFKIKP